MKKILFLSIIQLCFALHGQEQYIYKFEKLSVTDTIHDNKTISALQSDSAYKQDDYFIVGRDFEGEADTVIYCLIKKVRNYWISYAFPYEYCNNCSTVPLGPSGNKKYFLATSRYSHLSHGGGHGSENSTQKLIIVDIKDVSAIQVESKTEDSYWQTNENGDESSGKNILAATHILEDSRLIVVNTCFENQNAEYCANPGGLYEFINDKLIKIKHYDPLTKGFTTIRYAGKVAIGMTLDEVRLNYPNARFFEKENTYATCTDFEIGVEIWDGEELLGYALTKPAQQNTAEQANSESTVYNNEKIYRFIVLSPEINIEDINRKLTSAEIMKLYPKANVRLDLLSDWEHIYIPELNIELVFKTSTDNRMGKYEYETFKRIQNRKAKPDFIIVNQRNRIH